MNEASESGKRSVSKRVLSWILAVSMAIVACGGGSDEEQIADPAKAWPATPPPVADSNAADQPADGDAVDAGVLQGMQEFDGSGVGFRLALPADWIVVDLTDGEPEDIGAKILDVVPGSPADGVILPGDVIVGVDGQMTETKEELQEAILGRQPGEELVFLLDRPDPDTFEFNILDVPLTIGEHPDSGGAYVGIQFQTASIRPEFEALTGIVPQAEVNAYMFGTTNTDELVAVHPTGRPAFGVNVAAQVPTPDYAQVEADYTQFVRSLGGEVTAIDHTTISGRDALRIVSRQPTAVSGLTTVFYFSIRTEIRLYTLQFFSIDPEADKEVISDVVSTFTIVG